MNALSAAGMVKRAVTSVQPVLVMFSNWASVLNDWLPPDVLCRLSQISSIGWPSANRSQAVSS